MPPPALRRNSDGGAKPISPAENPATPAHMRHQNMYDYLLPAELFTIGHSTHDTAYFVGLLKQHGVTAVCDVRSHPGSEYNPQYNKNEIAGSLKHKGISYVFLGKELGARSDDSNCYENGRIQFEKLANQPLFQQGLTRLRRGVKKYTIALMCAEKDPVVCHRMILITRQLRLEFAIGHILEDGAVESNAEAEKRLLDRWKIIPDMFRDESRCIEQAYLRQGEKIGYVRSDHEIH